MTRPDIYRQAVRSLREQPTKDPGPIPAEPEQPETWGDLFRAGAVLLLVIASFIALVIAFEGVAR